MNRNTLQEPYCKHHPSAGLPHSLCSARELGPVCSNCLLVFCFLLHGFCIYQLLSSGFFPLEAEGVLVESLKGAPLSCFLTYLELSQDTEDIPTHTLTYTHLHPVHAVCFSSEKPASNGKCQSPAVPLLAARSKAHGHQLQASCWVLAQSQGASQCQDTFCCLTGTFVFLVFILVLIPSYSDILINLSPHQGFDLLICFYALQLSAVAYQESCSQLVSQTSTGIFHTTVATKPLKYLVPLGYSYHH